MWLPGENGGLEDDEEMAFAVAKSKEGVVMSHCQGEAELPAECMTYGGVRLHVYGRYLEYDVLTRHLRGD